MKKTASIALSAVGAIIALSAALISAPLAALANPSYMAPPVSTNVATSTFAYGNGYIGPGVGTTTLVYDSYYANAVTNGSLVTPAYGSYTKADSAVLEMQFSASSTAAVLDWRYEYSVDGTTWYPDALATGALNNATSTQVQAGPVRTFNWNYASSTAGSSQPGTAYAAFSLPVPERWTRVVFYTPPTAATSSVFARIIPAKEQK